MSEPTQEEPAPATDGDDSPTAAAEQQTPDSADLEGPRRRARREREERRAAQARATAIEEARREAKRRSLGKAAQEPKTLGRGAVRGLKLLMWTAVIAVVVVGLGLVLYFTPLMSARAVVVTGLSEVTQDEVVAAAEVVPGTPLLQVDTDAVAERVAGIRRVASVRVQRQYPSTLRVTVVERTPIVVRDYPDGVHLFDRDGVDFATCAVSGHRESGPHGSGHHGGVAGDDLVAARCRRLGRSGVGAVGRRDHADLDRWSRRGVGDHRSDRGEGAQTGRAAHPAGPNL